MNDVCSVQEAARIIGIDESLVRRYCKQGRISARPIGRQWALDRNSVLRFAATPRQMGNPKLLRSNKKKKAGK
jgi:excisionase family DNA binding protein